MYALKLDLAKEKKVREETQDRHYRVFGEQIQKLQDEIENENRIREE